MNKQLKDELEININNCYKASSDYSTILSSICRQIAFAEGALFWFVFAGFQFPPKYIIVGYLFLILYLLTDLSQYLFGYMVYKRKAIQNCEYLEKKITNEELYLIKEEDLYWVYKAMHLKLFFIALSSITIILIFAYMLICNMHALK